MTPLLVALVLTAVVLHAVWNAMTKSGGMPERSIASYHVVGSSACIVLAIFLREPFGTARIRAATLVAVGIVIMRWLST